VAVAVSVADTFGKGQGKGEIVGHGNGHGHREQRGVANMTFLPSKERIYKGQQWLHNSGSEVIQHVGFQR
jgi:hypothetical protein